MRLYHQYYRKSNPANRSRISGDKKKLHKEISKALQYPRENPRVVRYKPEGLAIALEKKANRQKLISRMEESWADTLGRDDEAAYKLLGVAMRLERMHPDFTPLRKRFEDDLIKAEKSSKAAKIESQAKAARKEIARRAPKTGASIDAFNVLGALEKLIAEGKTEYIPLRDTIKAELDGYFMGDSGDRALEEAVRDLTQTQVKLLRKEIDKARMVAPAVGFSYGRAAAIRRKIAALPEIQEKRSRIKKLQYKQDKADKAFRDAVARSILSVKGPYRYGAKRKAEMDKQIAGAREEMGSVSTYVPADPELWSKVEKALEKKFPYRYVPAKLKSVRKTEWERLIRLAHKDTPTSERKRIKSSLEDALRNRWRTQMVMNYEALGGREYLGTKIRKAKFESLGKPFPLGSGLFGVINSDGKKYRWHLIDSPDPPVTVHMSGTTKDVQGGSRQLKVAARVLIDLITMGSKSDPKGTPLTGWDYLSEKNRKWLSENKPYLSTAASRMILTNINKKHKVDKKTAVWLVDSAKLPEEKAEKVAMRRTSPFKGMVTGEERELKGAKNAYTVTVKKTMDGYRVTVRTKDGKEKSFLTKRVSDIRSKSAVLGGLMTGATEVSKAVSNPTKLRRLKNSSDRYFAKVNPKRGRRKNPPVGIPRVKASPEDIKSLQSLYAIPDDAAEAYRLGFYFGIIRGIDTCGVQNYFERRRIRKEFSQKLLSGAFEVASGAAGVAGAPAKKTRRKKSSTTLESLDAEVESMIAGLSEDDEDDE